MGGKVILVLNLSSIIYCSFDFGQGTSLKLLVYLSKLGSIAALDSLVFRVKKTK